VTSIGASVEIEKRSRLINEKLANYIPPRERWTPVDEAVYEPTDLYRVPVDKAQEMQLKSVKYAFTRHYTYNHFYRQYCEMSGITPDDLKTSDDLEKIPLLPDITFKQHPTGKDLAYWITSIFTGDPPHVVIKGANPTFDDVINAFNAAGLVVSYSSGTSGQHTVTPRDMKTFLAAEYALIKLRASMIDQNFDHLLLLFPKPTTTNLWIGRVMSVNFDMYKDVQYALDFAITADTTLRAMRGSQERNIKATASVQSDMQQRVVDKTIQWLECYDKTEESIMLSGPPFLFFQVMDTVQKEGKSFDFGERGVIETAGGWKKHAEVSIPQADFRKQVRDVLGIPESRCLDHYSMNEVNAFMFSCPEGHYLHTPYTYFKPLILDDDLMPTEYGEWGHFAFLDAIAQSYPGFIISGDEVRLLERCPVCDRLGPVLDPDIQRAKGEEVRGCSVVMRRVLEQILTRDNK
jgi:long-chain-fatty-acid---luciferin-component ligase